MKNISLPRLAIVLWFLNYAFFSLANYCFGGSHEIMHYVVYSTLFMAVELMCLGWIEDMA